MAWHALLYLRGHEPGASQRNIALDLEHTTTRSFFVDEPIIWEPFLFLPACHC
jgi:hypothetical protein